MNRPIRPSHGDGRTAVMAGRTITAIVAAIPPAVCRMIAPRARPSRVHTHSTRPAASTLPGTPGVASDTLRPWPDKMAWTPKNEANTTTSPTTSVTAPSTTALAASTARRRGAAANVVRISPVLNSELNASTPSTHTAITAYSRLSTPGSSGSARAAGAAVPATEGEGDQGAGPRPRLHHRDQQRPEGRNGPNGVWSTPTPAGHAPGRRSGAPGFPGSSRGALPWSACEVMGSSFRRGIRCSRR